MTSSLSQYSQAEEFWLVDILTASEDKLANVSLESIRIAARPISLIRRYPMMSTQLRYRKIARLLLAGVSTWLVLRRETALPAWKRMANLIRLSVPALWARPSKRLRCKPTARYSSAAGF